MRRLIPGRRATIQNVPPGLGRQRGRGEARRFALQDEPSVAYHRVVVEVRPGGEDEQIGDVGIDRRSESREKARRRLGGNLERVDAGVARVGGHLGERAAAGLGEEEGVGGGRAGGFEAAAKRLSERGGRRDDGGFVGGERAAVGLGIHARAEENLVPEDVRRRAVEDARGGGGGIVGVCVGVGVFGSVLGVVVLGLGVVVVRRRRRAFSTIREDVVRQGDARVLEHELEQGDVLEGLAHDGVRGFLRGDPGRERQGLDAGAAATRAVGAKQTSHDARRLLPDHAAKAAGEGSTTAHVPPTSRVACLEGGLHARGDLRAARSANARGGGTTEREDRRRSVEGFGAGRLGTADVPPSALPRIRIEPREPGNRPSNVTVGRDS